MLKQRNEQRIIALMGGYRPFISACLKPHSNIEISQGNSHDAKPTAFLGWFSADSLGRFKENLFAAMRKFGDSSKRLCIANGLV